jgi:hypothetical protein
MWTAIGLEVLKFALPILATVAAALVPLLLKKLLDKMGVSHNKELDAMIDKYVDVGVKYAERAATKKLGGRELKSEDKAALAVSTVLKELEKAGVRKIGEELIRARIEAYLESPDTPVGVPGNGLPA